MLSLQSKVLLDMFTAVGGSSDNAKASRLAACCRQVLHACRSSRGTRTVLSHGLCGCRCLVQAQALLEEPFVGVSLFDVALFLRFI